jgi:putative FmdB family regulatory protein
MPIYEYRCSSCGHELESIRKLSEAPLLNCPSCHRDALVKLMSASGFQLKGSGWYATDFKGGSKPAAAKPGADAKASDAKPADAKADAAATTPVAAPATTPAATPAKSDAA